MIPFKNRFHGHNSLSYVYKNGRAIRGHSVTIKFVKNSRLDNSRIAVVVSKKVLKSAVKRNLVRRRLYEYMRLRLGGLNSVYDIVIIVTSSDLIGMNHSELCSQLDQLMTRAKIEKSDLRVPK
jgi:ribonuclease P protein component